MCIIFAYFYFSVLFVQYLSSKKKIVEFYYFNFLSLYLLPVVFNPFSFLCLTVSCSLDLSDQCFYTNLRSRKLLAGIELSRGEETWLETEAMGGETVVNEQVEQTLLDYLTQVGIANNILLPTLGAAVNFELRHGFLQMIESNQFHGTDSEDPVAHLKRFLQLTGTINVQNMPTEYVRLDAFPFLLNGKAWD